MAETKRAEVVSYRLRAFWARKIAHGRLRHELDTTSDRGLADLGLSRGDIDTVVAGRFGRA